MAVSHEFILAALTQIDTGHGGSLVAKGWIGDVVARDGHVLVTLEVPSELGATLEGVRAAAEKTVHRLDGVVSATVVLTGDDGKAVMGVNPLERAQAQSCSVDGEAKTANEPTPMDEFISAVQMIADQHPDGAAHLAALGYRQNFPPKLMQLAKLLTPLLSESKNP